ncbi:MAG: hypothetical protein OQJ83_08320, partial [Altibacter sp.]|nr:hypothetical protein [Altibacter sp.]
WIVIAFLGYQLYTSISGPIAFNEVKEARYAKVIKNLKDIRDAELAHQEITGNFTGSFDSLVRFIDTAQFAIVQRRDTSFADVAKNKAFGIDEGYFIEKVLIDTLGYTPVKDSLFGGGDRYKTMMNIPVEGVDTKIELRAGKLKKNDATYSVFEARVPKDVILADQDKDLLAQEKQVVSVDGVNGPYIKVGSMNEVNTSGNWPKIYDTVKDQ